MLQACTFLVLSLLAAGEESSPVPLERFTLLVLEPAEGRAVLRSAEGSLIRVEAGDALPGTSAVVRAALDDKLVVEERSVGGARTAWMSPSRGGEAGAVRYLETRAPDEPTLVKPDAQSLETVEVPAGMELRRADGLPIEAGEAGSSAKSSESREPETGNEGNQP